MTTSSPHSCDPWDSVNSTVRLFLDGKPFEFTAAPHESLLRALRSAGHTATTGACEQGECGSCTVLVDGELRCSCLVPAAVCQGSTISTVTSAVRDDLAAALGQTGAVQCGFCTPGMVVTAEWLMSNAPKPLTRRDVQEGLAGNLCRCTGYEAILDAVLDVDRRRREAGSSAS